VLGNEVRTLIDEERFAGKHNIYWNSTDNSGRRVASGIYFYTISADNFTQTKKMVLMK
jgi:flagellar hook assembly protein FlgD